MRGAGEISRNRSEDSYSSHVLRYACVRAVSMVAEEETNSVI